MGVLRPFVILAAGVAIGGALVIAHRISEETGKNMGESFSGIPGGVRLMFKDMKVRAEEASSRARQAYEQKQAQMDAYLHGGGPAE